MINAITQSMMGMFLRCPQQFERRYIRDEIIPPGIAARRGSSVHKASQINFEQKIISEQDLPVGDLQDAARDHYIKLVKEEGVFIPKTQLSEKNTLLAGGLDAAVRLTKLYREDLAPKIQPALVEERIIIDAGLELPISGAIDVLTIDNWLPDMKTADRAKGLQEADNSLQLTFYAGLVADKTGKWPDRVSLEVLVNTKEPKLQTLPTTRGPEDWANLMLRVQMMIAQIQTGLFPPCSPDSWICQPRFCGYWYTCKYSIKRR